MTQLWSDAWCLCCFGCSEYTVSDVLSRSKVMVLILPGNNKVVNMIPLSQGQNMHDVSELFWNCSLGCPSPSGGEWGAIHLGQSLSSSSLKRTECWSGSQQCMQPNGRFWKHLRYHVTQEHVSVIIFFNFFMMHPLPLFRPCYTFSLCKIYIASILSLPFIHLYSFPTAPVLIVILLPLHCYSPLWNVNLEILLFHFLLSPSV